MKKRIFFLLAALLLAAAMPITVLAQGIPDSNQKGSITAHLHYPEGIGNMGSLTIYRVGVIRERDGNCSFVPEGLFAEKWDGYEDVRWAELAWELAEFAAAGGLEGITEAVQADGTVTFTNLELGLYLVTQQEAASGYEKINPFLIGVPGYENGNYVYQVDASPKIQPEAGPAEPAGTQPTEPTLPQTGQRTGPVQLLAVMGLSLFFIGWCLGLRKRKPDDRRV